MTTNIVMPDEKAFTGAMRAVVEEAGRDYVYVPEVEDSCRYLHIDRTPGCLIGRVLFRLGCTIEDLDRWDNLGGNAANSVLDILGFPVFVQYAARHAQNLQDAGASWGTVLDRYEEVIDGWISSGRPPGFALDING